MSHIEKWVLIKGLVAQNVAVGMALTSPVMNRTGASDERGTKSVTTTCAAGATRDVVNVLKENVEDQETVQSKEKEGNDVTVIDQKMVITPMETTQNKITEGSLGRRRRARPSCSGVCHLMSLRMIFVLP